MGKSNQETVIFETHDNNNPATYDYSIYVDFNDNNHSSVMRTTVPYYIYVEAFMISDPTIIKSGSNKACAVYIIPDCTIESAWAETDPIANQTYYLADPTLTIPLNIRIS